jgi:dihydroorotase
MDIVLKNVTIIAPQSAFHHNNTDIHISNGVIEAITPNLDVAGATIIEGNNLHVSIGWLDIFADFAEPGFEHNETLQTGAAAAAVAGFTHVMVLPNSNPVVDNKASVEFLTQRSLNLPITILPIGAVSKNCEGKALAEMYDMHAHGAIAFGDGRNSIQDSDVLLKALQYVSAKNAAVIQICNDNSLSSGGLMHEGVVSTTLGLPGIPSLAEEIMLARDIALLRYSNGKLHVTGVSTKKAVEQIRQAKADGLQISCSVTPYHLSFTDAALQGYDTNYKVMPPLRLEDDRQALIKGLQDGTIDAVASHHNPQNWDNKVCEFEHAKNGMATLQIAYSVLQQTLGNVDEVVNMLAYKNRAIFGIDIPTIAEGEIACLTVFEPETSYTLTSEMLLSKSKNCAYLSQPLQGKVVATIHKGYLNKNS